MRVIGLTGGIGMGKSTASACFRRHGLPVHDADRAVHALYAAGGAAVAPIGAAFPDAVQPDARGRPRIDRARLASLVLGNAPALKALEAIVHPLVRAAELAFLRRARARGLRAVVLDIPLLLETKGERRCDLLVVVSAPASVQAARVLGRAGMTEEKLAAIRARQMPDAEKRRRADIVVPTGLSRHHAQARLRRLLAELRAPAGCVPARQLGRRQRFPFHPFAQSRPESAARIRGRGR